MAEAAAKGLEDARLTGTRYQFRLADDADDAAIRQLVRETPMQGPVSVSLRCEPSFFGATGDGTDQQTLVVTDGYANRIVGMGSRSIRRRYVDGQPTNVGYLSGLRILPQYRRGTLLARGYREIRRLHTDAAAEYYLTTIVDGNRPAFESLAGRRASLPTYDLLGQYHTFVLPLRRRRSMRVNDELEIRPMRQNEFPTVVEFLRREGRSKLFFPCYQEADFFTSSATFQDLPMGDILTAWRHHELVGLVGIWNQIQFKQCVVEGYSPLLRWTRPAFNCLAKCLSWPTFPAVGQPVQTTYAAFPLIKHDESQILSRLLQAAGSHVRNRYPASRSILMGAFERDPLFSFLRKAGLYRFVSSVFLVYWDKDVVRPERFRSRNLFLELGCL